jgi:hypothetical protein
VALVQQTSFTIRAPFFITPKAHTGGGIPLHELFLQSKLGWSDLGQGILLV